MVISIAAGFKLHQWWDSSTILLPLIKTPSPTPPPPPHLSYACLCNRLSLSPTLGWDGRRLCPLRLPPPLLLPLHPSLRACTRLRAYAARFFALRGGIFETLRFSKLKRRQGTERKICVGLASFCLACAHCTPATGYYTSTAIYVLCHCQHLPPPCCHTATCLRAIFFYLPSPYTYLLPPPLPAALHTAIRTTALVYVPCHIPISLFLVFFLMPASFSVLLYMPYTFICTFILIFLCLLSCILSYIIIIFLFISYYLFILCSYMLLHMPCIMPCCYYALLACALPCISSHPLLSEKEKGKKKNGTGRFRMETDRSWSGERRNGLRWYREQPCSRIWFTHTHTAHPPPCSFSSPLPHPDRLGWSQMEGCDTVIR